MQYSWSVRSIATLAAFAAVAAIGACSDANTVAPSVAAPTIHAPASFTQIGSSVIFRVNNADGIAQEVGEHIVYIQPGAICDLDSSGYGPGTWDNDCNPLIGSVTVTATVFQGPDGQPYVDFQPAMRFSPRKQAYLFLRATAANAEQQMQRLVINYCNDLGVCVDESLTDPSLTPFRLDQYSVVGRRVKHFSGYVLTFEGCVEGQPCECPPDQVCPTPPTRRSGYMVASGEDDVIARLEQSGMFDRYRK